MPKITKGRSCLACGTDSSYNSYGYTTWMTNEPTNLFLCKKCGDHFISIPNKDPAIRKRDNDKYNPLMVRFLGKKIFLGWNPRKGKCEICGRKKGDQYINSRKKIRVLQLTQMHHYFYIPCMPWACMIESCVPCHNKTKTRTRKKVSVYYFNITLRKRTKKRGN